MLNRVLRGHFTAMVRVKDWVQQFTNSFLNAGISVGMSVETARKINVLNLFSFVGFSITFALGFRALVFSEYTLGAALMLAFALFLSSHLYLRFSSSERAYKTGSFLLQSVLIVLCLYLVYSGGTNQTGPLWIYLVPPVVMFFSGFRRGLITIGLFACAYSFVVFVPTPMLTPIEYSYEFKTRLLYSFLTLTFLAAFYEYSRQSSFQKLNELTVELERLAILDPLTHLFNRRGMLERIEHEWVRQQRNRGGLSFLLMDVDHFKRVNDEYGHETGDVVLLELAKHILQAIRKQDALARWGGEEFLLLLPDTTLEQAVVVAEKIKHMVALNPISHRGHQLTITLSIGVAAVEQDDEPDDTINRADKRLYAAKQQGRNRVVSD